MKTLTLPAPVKPRFRTIVRAEWTKFRSVRSFRWCLAVFALLAVGTSVIVAVAGALSPHGPETVTMGETVSMVQLGMGFAELVILVLGVLMATSEYRTGTIRVSLMSVPRWGRLLLAKALVLTAVVAVASQVAVWASFAIQYATGETLGGLEPEMLRALFGYAAYLAVLALFGMAVGAIVRHAAVGVLAGIGLAYLLPAFVSLAPIVGETAVQFLPFPAGSAIVNMTAELPWLRFGLCCAWAAAMFVLAIHLTHRRDA
ncbi:ABC transporter permease [Nonomuraea sp. NPDC003754]